MLWGSLLCVDPEVFQIHNITCRRVYIYSNEETKQHQNFDVVGILVRTKYCLVLNEMFNVDVNNNVLWVKLVEDNQVQRG